jgi:hypothetical protein
MNCLESLPRSDRRAINDFDCEFLTSFTRVFADNGRLGMRHGHCKAAATASFVTNHRFLYAFPFVSTLTAAESPQHIGPATVASAVQ